MCSKICIPVSTHNETQKKCINTAHKWQWNNCSANANSVKSRNTNSKYRRRDPLKTLCHMGPLHPMLNIRQPPKQLSHCRAAAKPNGNQKAKPQELKTETLRHLKPGRTETKTRETKNSGPKDWNIEDCTLKTYWGYLGFWSTQRGS